MAIAGEVATAEIETWWAGVFEELYAALRQQDVHPAGPGGALYSREFFEDEGGEVIAFVPLAGTAAAAARGRAGVHQLPAAELAVAVHRGSFGDLDRTYGALGTYVAEREIGVDGPIREYYTVTAADTGDQAQHRTEVCWPVFQTRPPAPGAQ